MENMNGKKLFDPEDHGGCSMNPMMLQSSEQIRRRIRNSAERIGLHADTVPV